VGGWQAAGLHEEEGVAVEEVHAEGIGGEEGARRELAARRLVAHGVAGAMEKEGRRGGEDGRRGGEGLKNFGSLLASVRSRPEN